MNDEILLKKYLAEEFALDLPPQSSFAELREKLSAYINQLIEKDFEKLVRLLYRIDVSEARLKYILLENRGADAGSLIADLMIERQMQKIKTREEFKSGHSAADAEEKW